MAKKQKSGVDKAVKKVSDEFEKTSSQIEGLVNDAFRQFDNLQNQVHEPVKKLIAEMEALREREMKRFSDELERRLNEFREIQQNILERVGIASDTKIQDKKLPSATKSPKKAAGSESAKRKTAAKSGTKTSAKVTNTGDSKKAAAPQQSTAKKSPAKKSQAAKSTGTPKKAKALDENDLTSIKGIGPATAEKMRATGITSIRQLAAPSEADDKKLQEFARMRGFETWKTEAEKLIS